MRIKVEIKVCHIFRTGSHELQTWYTCMKQDDPYLISAMSSKVKGQGRKVTWSVRQVLAWPICSVVPKTSNLLRKLPTSQAITLTRFEVKRSKFNIVTRPINAETESVSSTNLTSNLVGGWSMRYQLPWPAIKALWSWVIARGRGHTLSAAPATATQLV